MPPDSLKSPSLPTGSSPRAESVRRLPRRPYPRTTVLENTLVNTADRFMPTCTPCSGSSTSSVSCPPRWSSLSPTSATGPPPRSDAGPQSAPQPGPGAVKGRSPWPYFAYVIYATARKLELRGGHHQARKRYSQGLQLMTAYTYSHAIDNTTEALSNAGGQELQDNYDVRRTAAIPPSTAATPS